VVEIQAVGRDITTLKETERRLINREAMLRTTFDNIPIMLAHVGVNGELKFVNQHWADVLGWTEDEMRAHPDPISLTSPNIDQYEQVTAWIADDESEGWRDFETSTRDGTTLHTSWTKVVLESGDRLYIGQDISHRIELENQRFYANQLEVELEKERQLREVKDRFVSLIAHEFRTPLAVMTLSIDLIVRYFDQLSSDRILNKLGSVQNQIHRMVDLMEDALQFSKSRAGKIEYFPEEVDTAALLGEVIETFKLADGGQHPMVLEVDDGMMWTDPKLFEHVVSNLVSNALKYSPEGMNVTVEARRNAENWQVSVRDEGIGIPEKEMDKLFEPFHRAENAHHIPGTGLGLSIVKDYVQVLGGEIQVESTLGQGTTFHVRMPGRPVRASTGLPFP